MNRYWISWWSGYYEEEGCTDPPFQIWISGQKEREDDGLNKEQLEMLSKIQDSDEYDAFLNQYSKDDCSICACVDAESEEDIWKVVAHHFPDYEPRFCELENTDYDPSIGGRFANFKNKTSLSFPK